MRTLRYNFHPPKVENTPWIEPLLLRCSNTTYRCFQWHLFSTGENSSIMTVSFVWSNATLLLCVMEMVPASAVSNHKTKHDYAEIIPRLHILNQLYFTWSSQLEWVFAVNQYKRFSEIKWFEKETLGQSPMLFKNLDNRPAWQEWLNESGILLLYSFNSSELCAAVLFGGGSSCVT